MKSSTDNEFQKRQPQVKTLGAASSLFLRIYIVFVEEGIIAMFMIYEILSKFLTRPLICMKEATEKLKENSM